MPHAVNDGESQEDDDRLINLVLNAQPGQEPIDLNPDRELDTIALPDAEDYADISDDDLPDEEPATAHPDSLPQSTVNGFAPEPPFREDERDDDQGFDDLFGEGPFSDNVEMVGNSLDELVHEDGVTDAAGKPPSPTLARERSNSATPDQEDLSVKPPESDAADRLVESETAEEREQRLLFEKARNDWKRREDRHRAGAQDEDIPPPPESDAELLAAIWPGYSQNEVPRWQALFPGKRAYYLYKNPLKPPKPILPSKVNLDLEPDQERQFKLAPATSKRKRSSEDAEENGIVVLTRATDYDQSSSMEEDFTLDPLDENEIIGGVTIGDLRVLCEDWDADIRCEDADNSSSRLLATQDFREGGHNDVTGNSSKRVKLDLQHFLQAPVGFDDDIPSFDDPMELTIRLSRRAPLEPCDPNLLLDYNAPAEPEKKPKVNSDTRRTGGFTKQMTERWNISQDKSYDLLKENHSHKIRATLTKLDVKHSLPAIKLQYPFYKVQLSRRDARSFHRPTLQLQAGARVTFDKLNRVKRATIKEKDVIEVFASSKDLGMGDNSEMLLLEYSEECPTMLSNFGMNNRFVNYYRRKDAEDTARPKGEIGETQVLLPHDNSPFSIFGNVEPGDFRPTIHNEMYRAPVFKQDPKSTDFLVIRSTTGVDGVRWFIRNIQNLYVVGQQFPYVEVPGTHSRKVTDASKTRMKMISYRIYGRAQRNNSKKPWVPHEAIIAHVSGSDTASNRTKLREWMSYDAEGKTWRPRSGDAVPDEQTIRSWITPEQICLLDSMQVGHRHLQDAGYNKDGDEIEDIEDQSTEQMMAPWETTKNFLKACQGQAMLQLHGEGDPSGRGEAFSFIKTSMKGGFKAIGESIEDRLDARKKEELGGHKYNVARQQQAYNDAIRRIWDAQTRSLSSTVEYSDEEADVDEEPEQFALPARTPHSVIGTPAATARSRREDDSASQFSRLSATGHGNKVLRIRRVTTKYGNKEQNEEVIRDPKIIREYIRRRKEVNLERLRYVCYISFSCG